MKTLFKFLVVIFVAAAINVAATSCITKGDPKKAAQMEQLDSLANQVVYEIYGGVGAKPTSANHLPSWRKACLNHLTEVYYTAKQTYLNIRNVVRVRTVSNRSTF